ncbi:hypothetical protein [Acidianus manzaensis]|uniref:Uncharacterized protein n=1 Tax=Acidianus manzaensis TaxID=282676 RepID=A0A1W6K290_9CREN|nr:hypothetical protein [Acidianus manzaensis]ARM76607.1 hypothetical protein B6F84_11645 [Acidianus manzaensis]
MTITRTTYGSNTALSALGDLAGELASSIESFTNLFTSQSAVCQDLMKTQITDDTYNYPALSVPGSLTENVPEDLQAIDIIRHGIIVEVKLDGEYYKKYNRTLQKAHIKRQINTAYVFIGSVTPYGASRTLHIYKRWVPFYTHVGADFYSKNGNKIIVIPVTKKLNFRKKKKLKFKKWYKPNGDPGCNLGIFAPDNILTSQSKALVAMANYAINMATYYHWFFRPISDPANLLAFKFGEKYIVGYGVAKSLSFPPPMLWYPVLLNAPSFISKLLSNNYIAVTLPPNFTDYTGYAQDYINRYLKPLEALAMGHMDFLDHLTTALGSGITLGSPIFYSNNCETSSSCSKEFLLGLVDGIANISQPTSKPLIVYTIRRVKLPTTMSEAYELAKSWGVGDVFDEVLESLLTYMPVFVGVEKEFGCSIDELDTDLGIDVYEIVNDVVNAGLSAGKSVDDMVNEAVNKLNRVSAGCD